MTQADIRTLTTSDLDDSTFMERRAFHGLIPITPEYPILPIAKGFNWSEVLSAIDEGSWYLVVFRSVRKVSADMVVLTEYDEQAHREALEGSGLLFYFQGQLNARRECLSFCVWQNQRQAQVGARLPLHQAAAQIAGQMYDSYRLERYTIRKERGVYEATIERAVGEPPAVP